MLKKAKKSWINRLILLKNINRVIYYKESQNENIIEYKNHIKNIINLENLEIYINSLNSEKKSFKNISNQNVGKVQYLYYLNDSTTKIKVIQKLQ